MAFWGTIPTYNTIGNWVQKYGLEVYSSSGKALSDKDYATVIDESMMIGSEKLLVTLAVPALHQGRPLSHTDVSVVDMSVAASWNGQSVKARLEQVEKKAEHAPQYLISDNASVLNKAARLFEVPHHRDISHSLGIYLERIYKNEVDFKDYLQSMTEVKFKHNMKRLAYLLPPTQRTVARFINLSSWVKWSGEMLDVYHTLSEEEKHVFSFIPGNASFINEMVDVMDCIQNIEHICKHQGLSKASVKTCKTLIRQTLFMGNSRMIRLGIELSNFLNKEAALLKSDEVVRNNSTDIIESIFGTYKSRKSPNKLHGVTPFILFIPAYTQLVNAKDAKQMDIKNKLEDIKLKDIRVWSTNNITENQVTKRMRKMKLTA